MTKQRLRHQSWLLLSLPLVAALSSWLVAATSAPAERILDLPVIAQERGHWCWAATGQMAMQFESRNENHDVRQCSQASKKLRLDDPIVRDNHCCGGGVGCDFTGWPVFGLFSFGYKTTTDRALTWNELTSEIDAGRPFCASIKWARSRPGKARGHMFLVRGYAIDEHGDKWVYIIDPEPVPDPNSKDPDRQRGGTPLKLSYDDYIENHLPGSVPGREYWDAYTHWHDFYAITPD